MIGSLSAENVMFVQRLHAHSPAKKSFIKKKNNAKLAFANVYDGWTNENMWSREQFNLEVVTYWCEMSFRAGVDLLFAYIK